MWFRLHRIIRCVQRDRATCHEDERALLYTAGVRRRISEQAAAAVKSSEMSAREIARLRGQRATEPSAMDMASSSSEDESDESSEPEQMRVSHFGVRLRVVFTRFWPVEHVYRCSMKTLNLRATTTNWISTL